jgi:hypothetical protein
VGMPILTLTNRQLLALTNTTANQYRQDKFREQAVAAFGAAEPVLEDRPLLVDAMAMIIRDDLARSIPRRAAATTVRAFWDKWIDAVARVEHRDEAVVFAVAEQSEGVWWCGTGPAEQLPAFVANQPPLRRLVIANVPQLYTELQNRADKLGFDLAAGELCLAPDDPLFISWVTEFREQREALQRKFDPLHGGRAPPRPSAQQRKALETRVAVVAAGP